MLMRATTPKRSRRKARTPMPVVTEPCQLCVATGRSLDDGLPCVACRGRGWVAVFRQAVHAVEIFFAA